MAMKAIVDFPQMICHIDMMRCKRVRVHDDVIDRYAEDDRWRGTDQLKRMSTVDILRQVAGQECDVIMAWRVRGLTMYGLQLDRQIFAIDTTGTKAWMDRCQVAADYTQVLDSGFMEAR